MNKTILFYISILLSFLLVACNGIDATETTPDLSSEVNTVIDEGTELEAEENQQEDEELQANFITVTVVRVIDGDTILIRFENGVEERVRLLLVDTPESVHPDKPVQPFGPEASQFAKDMMPEGSTVKLELDVGERDKYGRLLAYVWVGDKMFNELLLEKGLARVAYVFAPNTRHVDRFYEIQKQAQQQAVGIWSIENYATDKGFNEEVTKKNEKTKEVSNSSKGGCEEPLIKGNHSSNGERIYHVPGGQFYEKTNPEEMFCTEEEAVAAGYRKSKR